MGVRHADITGKQLKLYKEWAAANPGKKLTTDAMKKIEIEAMIKAGVPADYASNAVNKEYERLKQLGITIPNNIPWAGKN